MAGFSGQSHRPHRRPEFAHSQARGFFADSIKRQRRSKWKKPHLEAWAQGLHEHAIQPIQQFDLIKGKNATDMAMAVDAMDILFNQPVDVFCIVSSDLTGIWLCTQQRTGIRSFDLNSFPDPGFYLLSS
ncbi:MAG: NYN domain-containing protein [Pusillimonas sp.]